MICAVAAATLAAAVASLFTLRLGRLILCRLLFKLARAVTAMAEAILDGDERR
jgi:hypothetical protein